MLGLVSIPAVGFSQAPLPIPVPEAGQPFPAQQVPGQPIPVPAANQQVLAPNQMDGLVAPLALYPDPLISQILVASTYPLEVVEANQWLQQHPELSGQALTQAAASQNWDPSVQALVMFPDVLKRLNEDVSWTTALGNAFLNQQADVMGAIQRLRVSAEQSGKLASTPQQQVINTTDAGQPVVQIVPANPDVIYVPSYDPAYVWGPPIYYPYPSWYYPPLSAGLFFGAGIGIGGFFGVGWGGWGAWGWHPGWGSRTIFVNHGFTNRFNFNSRVAGFRGTSVWSHDVFHRQGVPYSNHAVAQRFAPAARQAGIAAPRTAGVRSAAPMARSFAASPRASMPSAAPRQSFANRSTAQGFANRNSFAATRSRNPGNGYRSYAAPSQSYAPQARSNAPQARSFAPQARSSAPMARSAAPSVSRGGGGSFSSHGGGGSHSSGGSHGGGSHGGGGGRR
ncbi:MAG TPA: DUF3300 domain-containing protein [Terriglobia bacterium]